MKHIYFVNNTQCYMTPETYSFHKEQILWLNKHINSEMKKVKEFKCVNLVETGTQIEIRMCGKDECNTTYAGIDQNWSNLSQAVDRSIYSFLRDL